jgi:hypothetical protein
MRCPACGHEFANPTAQAGGRAGGAAKVSKGFSSPAVRLEAMLSRGLDWAGVYTLTDPRNGSVFWVGVAKRPARRRTCHVGKAKFRGKYSHNPALDKYLLDMNAERAYPKETVVAAGPREEMWAEEKRVIENERRKGSPLLNIMMNQETTCH